MSIQCIPATGDWILRGDFRGSLKEGLLNERLLKMLLSADETLSSENPFNSYTKLQIILNKAKSPRNIEWCMFAMQLDWQKYFTIS